MDKKIDFIAISKKHPKAITLILIVFFLFLTWIIDNKPSKDLAPVPAEELASLDTFIPRGFVLVPIEIQNIASVDSILGQYGIVDIYSEGESSAIGKGLKLIRSPKDPLQFAVLVNEDESKTIVRFSHKPFQVIVQSPTQDRTQVRQLPKSKNRILWEDK